LSRPHRLGSRRRLTSQRVSFERRQRLSF
jgi:hypothetical protein